MSERKREEEKDGEGKPREREREGGRGNEWEETIEAIVGGNERDRRKETKKLEGAFRRADKF